MLDEAPVCTYIPLMRRASSDEQVNYTNQPSALGILENEDKLKLCLPAIGGKPTKMMIKVFAMLIGPAGASFQNEICGVRSCNGFGARI